ncbi:hypothetical protein ACJ73_04486 [Blastomyces percursus]|uniref:EXPERA domain-containing protein n=1 Tax=Blastomyces percursus TaxID=1658174 RepID=A0A1J9R6L7_9EURO|nr:hypothetical protein ACJ73_04486 [Blastomyces percursus]
MVRTPPQRVPPRSIWSRKLDILYVVFLSTTVFLAFAIDFVPFYPAGLFPQWATAVHDFYVNNYNDPLYVKDPPFFQLFVAIEVLYSVPLSLWAIRGLIQDNRMLPLYLLPLATHLVLSTVICFVEVWNTQDWPAEDINKNLPGYIGFFVIVIYPLSDSFCSKFNCSKPDLHYTVGRVFAVRSRPELHMKSMHPLDRFIKHLPLAGSYRPSTAELKIVEIVRIGDNHSARSVTVQVCILLTPNMLPAQTNLLAHIYDPFGSTDPHRACFWSGHAATEPPDFSQKDCQAIMKVVIDAETEFYTCNARYMDIHPRNILLLNTAKAWKIAIIDFGKILVRRYFQRKSNNISLEFRLHPCSAGIGFGDSGMSFIPELMWGYKSLYGG